MINKKKSGFSALLITITAMVLMACSRPASVDVSTASTEQAFSGSESAQETEGSEAPTEIPTEATPSWEAIGDGDTLETRIQVPLGYERTEVEEGSFGEFVRNYPMKPDGSEVLLYDGTPKGYQGDHMAVFALPIEDRDLQQCADSVMRMYGEYYYSRGEYDKIRYNMGGGFTADFGKWCSGFTMGVDGDRLYWEESSRCNESYESFVKFMHLVFAYSGTLHMEDSTETIELSQADIGDLFIKGGSPGHVVMIVDVCEDANGKKAYLMGQGYMPAQEFHVIRNPLHPEDPWYYEDEITYPLKTASYTFPEGSLKRYNIS